MKLPVLALLFVVAFPASDWAHGGTYRPPPPPPPRWGPGPGGGGGVGPAGPRSPSGPAPTPAGPAGPGPATGRPALPPLPITGAPDDFGPDASWREWWSYNHDAYLDLRARLESLATTSGENPLVAQRRRLQAALAPALEARLAEGGEETVIRQALLALARLARTQHAVALERFTKVHLAHANPNLQEAALLALGIEGRPESLELLRHVLMDDEAGRAAVHGGGRIAPRLRAVAAYALGLMGEREPSEDVRRQVVHALLFALSAEEGTEREVRVACALSLGIVPIAPCADAVEALDPVRQIEELHLCGGVQTEYLLGIVRDLQQDPWLRGHAAAALGRLAVRAGPGLAPTEDHPAVLSRAELLAALTGIARTTKGLEPLVHGAHLALGAAADGDGDEVDRGAGAQLEDSIARGQPMTRAFALIGYAAALGRPGGGEDRDAAWEDGSKRLLRELSRARGDRAAWTALALGVTGHGRAAAGESLSAGLAGALRQSLAGTKDGEVAAAHALALAVVRAPDTRTQETLAKAFESLDHAGARACTALALGMLGARDAQPLLEEALDERTDSLADVLAIGIGLRLLGDPDVVPELVTRLEHAGSVDAGLAIVRTLALLQDPAAGEPLLALVDDEKRPHELRAAITWCLGALADPEWPDWTALYANGLDYNFLPWTLRSPLGDGRGVLDWR